MDTSVHNNARLILVFRPPKNSDQTPRIRGSEHYYFDYKNNNLILLKLIIFLNISLSFNKVIIIKIFIY
jgi:hypothetical protein